MAIGTPIAWRNAKRPPATGPTTVIPNTNAKKETTNVTGLHIVSLIQSAGDDAVTEELSYTHVKFQHRCGKLGCWLLIRAGSWVPQKREKFGGKTTDVYVTSEPTKLMLFS